MNVRNSLTLACCLLTTLIVSVAFAEVEFAGYWVMPDGSAVVEVEETPELGEWCMRILALREPAFTRADSDGVAGEPRTDVYNPDEQLRSRPLTGLQIGSGFHREGEKLLGGRIYDPGTGRHYRATFQLGADGLLEVRGFIGVSLLGRTMHWHPLAQYQQQMTNMLSNVEPISRRE